MKIIITESQYKLITEREDEKNIQEVNEILNLFMDKLNNGDFSFSEFGREKIIKVRVDTKFRELNIILKSEQNENINGQYVLPTITSLIPTIVIYNCHFRGMDVNINNKIRTIKHEIVHFIDDRKKRIKSYDSSDLDKYHNNAHEINAEFIAITNQILLKNNIPNTFGEFLKLYKTFSHFDLLNDKNKKSLIGRLYQYYIHLKDKQKEDNRTS